MKASWTQIVKDSLSENNRLSTPPQTPPVKPASKLNVQAKEFVPFTSKSLTESKFVPVTVNSSPKLRQNNEGWETLNEEQAEPQSPASENDNEDDLMSRILRKAKNLSAEDFQVIKNEIEKNQKRQNSVQNKRKASPLKQVQNQGFNRSQSQHQTQTAFTPIQAAKKYMPKYLPHPPNQPAPLYSPHPPDQPRVYPHQKAQQLPMRDFTPVTQKQHVTSKQQSAQKFDQFVPISLEKSEEDFISETQKSHSQQGQKQQYEPQPPNLQFRNLQEVNFQKPKQSLAQMGFQPQDQFYSSMQQQTLKSKQKVKQFSYKKKKTYASFAAQPNFQQSLNQQQQQAQNFGRSVREQIKLDSQIQEAQAEVRKPLRSTNIPNLEEFHPETVRMFEREQNAQQFIRPQRPQYQSQQVPNQRPRPRGKERLVKPVRDFKRKKSTADFMKQPYPVRFQQASVEAFPRKNTVVVHDHPSAAMEAIEDEQERSTGQGIAPLFDTVPKSLKDFYWFEKNPPNLLQDYDAIGFDMENAFIKFNVTEMTRLIMKTYLTALHEDFQYPAEIVDFKFSKLIGYAFNNAVWDIKNGTILKLTEHMRITHSIYGFKPLTPGRMKTLYGNPPMFRGVKWPESSKTPPNSDNPHWVLSGIFDTAKIPVICQVVDAINNGKVKKTYQQFSYDLYQIECQQMQHCTDERVLPIGNFGKILSNINDYPHKYIQKQPVLKTILAALRSNKKQIFLTTNFHVEVMELFMTMTLGKDWKDYFDVCIANAKKPLWHRSEQSFYEYAPRSKNLKGRKISKDAINDQVFYANKIFLEGNCLHLTAYIQRLIKKSDAKICFIGGDFLKDVHATFELNEKLSRTTSKGTWDSIAVVHEFNFETAIDEGDNNCIPWNKDNWGASYFFDVETMGLARNYFLAEIERVSRYAIASIQQCRMLLGSRNICSRNVIRTQGLLNEDILNPYLNPSKWRSEKTKQELIFYPTGQHLFTVICLHGAMADCFLQMFTSNKPFPVFPFEVPEFCKLVLPISNKKDDAHRTDQSWFSCDDYDDMDGEDLQPCEQYVTHILEQEVKVLKGDSSKIFLGGFGQGCIIALTTFLKFKQGILGGVFGFQGCAFQDLQWKKIDIKMKNKTPVYAYNISYDLFFDEQKAAQSYTQYKTRGLTNLKYEVESGMKKQWTKKQQSSLTKFLKTNMTQNNQTKPDQLDPGTGFHKSLFHRAFQIKNQMTQKLQQSSSKLIRNFSSNSNNIETKQVKIPFSNQLKDGEMRSLSIDSEQEILITKLDGQLFATGNKCTHYGVDLSKGVLFGKKLVCPAHAASFDITTGESQSGPGLDSLPVFPIEKLTDGSYAVKVPQKLPQNAEVSMSKRDLENKRRYVIIGGGPAGLNCAETLRRQGFTGEINLLSEDNHLAYDRTKLSKVMPEESSFNYESFYLRSQAQLKNADIDVRLKTSVSKVDAERKRVYFEDNTHLKYDKLCIATGSKAHKPNIEGIHSKNVFCLRTLNDLKKIQKAAEEVDRVVIVGSSFIGMELASTLATSKAFKLKTLNLVGKDKIPFANILGPEIGQMFVKEHQLNGVEFQAGAEIEQIISWPDTKKVHSVRLSTGKQIMADMVIFGTGVDPATTFLEYSGVEVNPRGNVVCDEFLRTNIPDIYAAGDIIEYPYRGEYVTSGHWVTAQDQGAFCALNMLSVRPNSKFKYSKVPFFWIRQYSKSLQYVGNGQNFHSIHFDGDFNKNDFIAYYISKDDKVLAAAAMGRSKEILILKEALEQDKLPSGSKIINKEVSLQQIQRSLTFPCCKKTQQQKNQMKFRYFPLYGRAEAIRMLLHHSGTEFQDDIIPRPLTKQMKDELPNRQVPVLEWEGHQMSQSVPILRCLGSMKGYYNKQNALEAYKADLTIATVDDYFIRDFYRIFFEKEACSESEIAERVRHQDKLFKLLENQLGFQKYFGGDSISIADFYVSSFIFGFTLNETGNPAQQELYLALRRNIVKYPKLMDYAIMTMQKELKDYLKFRPKYAL